MTFHLSFQGTSNRNPHSHFQAKWLTSGWFVCKLLRRCHLCFTFIRFSFSFPFCFLFLKLEGEGLEIIGVILSERRNYQSLWSLEAQIFYNKLDEYQKNDFTFSLSIIDSLYLVRILYFINFTSVYTQCTWIRSLSMYSKRSTYYKFWISFFCCNQTFNYW